MKQEADLFRFLFHIIVNLIVNQGSVCGTGRVRARAVYG